MITLILPYWKIILSSASVYVFIVVAIRVFGKNELCLLYVGIHPKN